jgi:hypothetical protein
MAAHQHGLPYMVTQGLIAYHKHLFATLVDD